MERQQAAHSSASGFQARDEDLTSLLPPVAPQEDEADGGDNEAGQTAPDEALSELLEVIEGEAQTGDEGEQIGAPSGQAGAASRGATVPLEPSSSDASRESDVCSEPETRTSLAGEIDDSSDAPSEAHTLAAGPTEQSESPAFAEPGPLPVDDGEAAASDVTQASRPRWSQYLATAKAVAGQLSTWADDALDSLHPRARDAVGVAGLVMLFVALGLFVVQVLGWI